MPKSILQACETVEKSPEIYKGLVKIHKGVWQMMGRIATFDTNVSETSKQLLEIQDILERDPKFCDHIGGKVKFARHTSAMAHGIKTVLSYKDMAKELESVMALTADVNKTLRPILLNIIAAGEANPKKNFGRSVDEDINEIGEELDSRFHDLKDAAAPNVKRLTDFVKTRDLETLVAATTHLERFAGGAAEGKSWKETLVPGDPADKAHHQCLLVHLQETLNQVDTAVLDQAIDQLSTVPTEISVHLLPHPVYSF
jgi:hypothetical protein